MADSSSSDEEDVLDDLEGLQRELEALREQLGDFRGSQDKAPGDEDDASENEAELPSPGAALAAVASAGLSLPRDAAAVPPPSSSQEQAVASRSAQHGSTETGGVVPRREETRGRGAEDGSDEEDEEQRQRREEAEEAQQAAQMVAAALHAGGGRSTLRNRQLLAVPPAPPAPGKPGKNGAAAARRGQQPAAAKKAGATGTTGKAKAKKAGGLVRLPARAASPPPSLTKVEAVRAALQANTQLQARLRRMLTSIDRAMDRNAAVLHQVRVLRAKKRAAPAVTSAGAGAASAEQAAPAGTSWYWGSYAAGHRLAAGDDLPPNVDGAALQPLLSHLPFSFRYSRWSEEEQQRLRDGVLQLAQEVQLQEVMQEMQQRLESGGAVGMADYEASRQRIAALTLDSPVVGRLAGGFGDQEWSMLLQRSRLHRTLAECRLQWSNSLAPSLSQGQWSAEEDEKLRELAQQHEGREWDAVSRELAAALGSAQRPALTCLQRYQQLAAVAAKDARQFEAGEGVARLAELVAQHGSSWKRIAEAFGGGWEAEQLMHIWRRHAQRGPVARKGKWSKEEDETLLQAMAVHGRKWSLVARLVPGRTDVQCRERYMNVLNPDVVAYKEWTGKDDRRLVDLAAQHTQADGKVRWSAVAASMPGRTDKHCAMRMRILLAGDSRPGKKANQRTSGSGGRGGGRGRGRGRGKRKASVDAGSGEEPAGQPAAAAGASEGEAVDEEEGGGGPDAKRPRRSKRMAAGVTSRGGRVAKQQQQEQQQQGETQPQQQQQQEEAQVHQQQQEETQVHQQQQQEEAQPQHRQQQEETQPQHRQQQEETHVHQQQQQEEAQAHQQEPGEPQQQLQQSGPSAALSSEQQPAHPMDVDSQVPAQQQQRAGRSQEGRQGQGAAARLDEQQEAPQPKPRAKGRQSAQAINQQRTKPSHARQGRGRHAASAAPVEASEGEEGAEAPLLAAPPPPTAATLPCLPEDAVGQAVSVWWVLDEPNGRGSMYPGTVVGWNRRRQEHSVQYGDGSALPTACRLAQETVEWHEAGGVVTGPGARWPGAGGDDGAQQQAQQAQQAAGTEDVPAASLVGAQQRQPVQAAERAGARPARQRRPSAKAAEALELEL